MKNKTIICSFIALLSFTCSSYAFNEKSYNMKVKENNNISQQQTNTVKGNIVDGNDEPVIGANITIKGKKGIGTITDIDGNFTLSNVKNGDILLVSYIGFKDKEIRITESKNFYNIKLQDDTENLDEIVVVGYGTQTKVNLTGSVGTISKKDLIDRPATNISSSLQGLTPGLTVTSGNGNPGRDGATIRIRGVGTLNSSDPYILVDGIETGTLNEIDPNDIESMSVLKDAASAAIYGSKAANGVILITTKRGSSGKPVVAYSGNVSISNVSTLIDRLSSYDYARLYNEASVQEGSTPRFSEEDLMMFQDGSDPYGHPNTQWSDYIYQTGFMHKHNLNISGGTDNIKYMTSLGFLGQEGTMRNSDRSQFNIRTNIDIKLSDKFAIRTNMSFIHNNHSNPIACNGGGVSDLIEQMNTISPWVPYKNEDGTYGCTSDGNPAAAIDVDGRNKYYTQNFTGSFAIDYNLIKDLKFTLQGSYITNLDESKYYRKEIWYDNVNYTGPTQLTESISRWSRFSLDALVNYNKTFKGGHTFKAMAGYKIEKSNSRTLTAARKNFQNTYLTDLDAGSNSTMTNSGGSRELAMMSYFGRLNYDYKGKYLLEANFRADASSRFAKEYRWGYFPAFSAGWRISEESFMEGTKDWLQSLKIRGSWGQLGNQNAVSNYYAYLNTLTIGKNYPFDGIFHQGITQNDYRVYDITWEKSSNWGIGFDANFLKEFMLSVEYYNRKTNGIIMNVPVPWSFGISGTYQDNVGSLRNSGVEISFNWNHNFNKNWRVGFSANYSYNKNELLDLGGVDEQISGYMINRIGKPYQSFYIFVADGLFQSDEEAAAYEAQYGNIWNIAYKAGDFRIKDTNGDGIITNDDRVVAGSQQPKGTYAFTLSGGWKNFDVSVFMQGVTGTNRYYDYHAIGMFEGEASHPCSNWLDAWSEENPNTNWPRVFLNDQSINSPNKCYNTFWCMNTDYLRVKNINVSYTFPKNFIKRLGLANAKIYYTGENLFTFDHLPFNADPESPSGNLNAYPTSKTHSFGINLTF